MLPFDFDFFTRAVSRFAGEPPGREKRERHS
jgi:hypothetical protein